MTSEYEQALIDKGIPQGGQIDWWGNGYRSEGLLFDGKITTDDYEKNYARRTFVQRFGFAIPNDTALQTISRLSPILEIGAGSGYWSYELHKLGATIVATDPAPIMGNIKHRQYKFDRSWIPVQPLTGYKALKQYPNHTPLLIWPSYDEKWAAQTLRSYKGNYFIYVGEGDGGCCANDAFFRLLEKEYTVVEEVVIPQWHGVHDCLTVYQRKSM